MLLQATLAGQGLSLGILDFIRDELSSGRLQQPFSLQVDPGDAYHLVWRQDTKKKAAALKVKDWLQESVSQPK